MTELSIQLSSNAQLRQAAPTYGEANGDPSARLRLHQETHRPGLLPLYKIGRAAGATAIVWLRLRDPELPGPTYNSSF